MLSTNPFLIHARKPLTFHEISFILSVVCNIRKIKYPDASFFLYNGCNYNPQSFFRRNIYASDTELLSSIQSRSQEVKSNIALCVRQLFTGEVHGYKITKSVVINILTAALCLCESIFTVCQSLADSPTDKIIANNIIKLLPPYQKLQQLINVALAGQLPKKFFRKARRLAIDLALIPYPVRSIAEY